MDANVNLIKGLEFVNVTKESMLNSHTPGEYIVAGLVVLFLLFVLIFALNKSIRDYTGYKKLYGDGCGNLFWVIYISFMLMVVVFMGIFAIDIGIRDLEAQSRGEENCIAFGKECSREVLEVKVDEEEVGEIGIGKFMGEFIRKYEVVEIGNNGVWKVVVRG